jgi:cytochrome c
MNGVIMRDIPLDLPAPRGLLEALLVLFFLLHIFFVHLMLGSSLFSLVCQVKGLRVPDYDRLANRIVQTITVNKSLAVVLGVGPLLAINTIYTPYFYTSSALIGDAWMSVIPLVAIAFLLAYAHKYWWDKLAKARELHIGIAVIEAAIFLIVPLIFMTNVNLMLFPDRWPEVKGFFSAMLLPNVLQRYLHFISASVLFTTLFFAWWTGRETFREKAGFVELQTAEVRRFFYSFAFGATILQILSGLLVFATIPAEGLSWTFTLTLAAGAAPVVLALRWMWLDLTGPDEGVGKRLKPVVVVFAVTVVAMGVARHAYRETALADYRVAVAKKTAAYVVVAKQAAEEEKAAKTQAAPAVEGQAGFEENCSACHNPTEKTVGPSLKEIQGIYATDPAGIVKWAKAPGKKRTDAVQMPAFSHLSDEELGAIGRYILSR